MQQKYQLDTVTLLFADGTEGMRCAVKLYAEEQCEVELCAAVATGAEVLELLQSGLRPQVLVLDALLQTPNIFHLMQQIYMLEPGYSPAILVTSVTAAAGTMEKLLTSGANYTILKPYTLAELFDTVVQWGSSKSNLAVYRVREHLNKMTAELGVSPRMYGLTYLEQIICCMVLGGKSYSAEELYQRVAENEQVTPGAVSSAIRRIGDAMCRSCTPSYLRLCTVCGKTPGAHLTNAEILREISNRISYAMRL